MSAPLPEFSDLSECLAKIGGKNKPIGRSTFYDGIAAGIYPKPVHVGPHTARWITQEIDDAIRARIAKRKVAKR